MKSIPTFLVVLEGVALLHLAGRTLCLPAPELHHDEDTGTTILRLHPDDDDDLHLADHHHHLDAGYKKMDLAGA